MAAPRSMLLRKWWTATKWWKNKHWYRNLASHGRNGSPPSGEFGGRRGDQVHPGSIEIGADR